MREVGRYIVQGIHGELEMQRQRAAAAEALDSKTIDKIIGDTMDGWDCMHVRVKRMYRWMNGHSEGK